MFFVGCFSFQNATEELDRLERAFQDVKKQLFDQLHGILREQLFHMNGAGGQNTWQAQQGVPSRTSAQHEPVQIRSNNGHNQGNEVDQHLDSSEQENTVN